MDSKYQREPPFIMLEPTKQGKEPRHLNCSNLLEEHQKLHHRNRQRHKQRTPQGKKRKRRHPMIQKRQKKKSLLGGCQTTGEAVADLRTKVLERVYLFCLLLAYVYSIRETLCEFNQKILEMNKIFSFFTLLHPLERRRDFWYTKTNV